MRTRYIELGAGPEFFAMIFQIVAVIIFFGATANGTWDSVAVDASVVGLETVTISMVLVFDKSWLLRFFCVSAPTLVFVLALARLLSRF